jgi:hypothetical protein
MSNKKGEGSSITLTVAIIIAVLILVFLIWGFSTQWKFFTTTGTGIGGKTNIDTLRQACEFQCDNNQRTEFCLVNKTVIDENGKSSLSTCNMPPLLVNCPDLCV